MNRPLPRGDRCHRGADPGGYPDLQGRFRALADWSAELRLLRGLAIAGPRLAHVRSGGVSLRCGPRPGVGPFRRETRQGADRSSVKHERSSRK